MTTQDKISAVLEKYERFGIDLSLDRIKTVLERLGDPQKSVPIVHVTGTNGKGSVCAYLSAVLTEAGYKVGRYTSPHLVAWNERIFLNEKPIETEPFIDAILKVEGAAEGVALTQFEVITAAAWLFFSQVPVDVAVIEVGLGGRLDATNVCDRALISVITSLTLEHQQRLGSTLAKIAQEKAGIIKPDCPVVVGQLPTEAMDVVKARAKELDSPLIQPPLARRVRKPEQDQAWAIAQDISFPLALNGGIQLLNSALAIAAILSLREQGWDISDEAIQSGMGKTSWPGRLEWTTFQGKRLLIDGAHNPAAAQVLRDFVDRLKVPNVHWMMGMLSTKDHQEIFETLLRPGDRLSLVPVSGHSSAEVEKLKAIAQKSCPKLAQCSIFDSLEAGLSSWATRPDEDQTITVLCGSLYMLGAFLAMESSTIVGV